MNMQRREREGKKGRSFAAPRPPTRRVALELAGGFGCTDEQKQLWCFGWRAADIAAKINTSSAACFPEEQKKRSSCCFNTISVFNLRFYSSGTDIHTPNCNMSHLFSLRGDIRETIERRRERARHKFVFELPLIDVKSAGKVRE